MIAALLAACAPPGTAPFTSQPATATSGASASAVASTPTATPSAAPTAPAVAELRVALDGDSFPAIGDDEVLIYTRRLTGRASRIEARDLRTGATTVVRANADMPQVTAIRDGVFAFVESSEGVQPQTERVRVSAGRWRDPSTITQLDDLVIAIAGGDAWNPWPVPQTNGYEIAWLHAAVGTGDYELRLRDANGQIRTAYTSRNPFTFALARNGDLAIGEIATPGQTTPVRLLVYSGSATRSVVQRPPSGSGYVHWLETRIAWSNGLGLVVPMRDVELVDPVTLARETVSPPPTCFGYAGSTDAQVAFLCGDHVELVRGPGPARVGPPVPLVHARAIIRTEQGPPRMAFVTSVNTNDPRPGAGARF